MVNQNLVKVRNFIVLGDIYLSDCEKKFLDVYYKCRENRSQTNVDVEVEVSKNGH